MAVDGAEESTASEMVLWQAGQMRTIQVHVDDRTHIDYVLGLRIVLGSSQRSGRVERTDCTGADSRSSGDKNPAERPRPLAALLAVAILYGLQVKLDNCCSQYHPNSWLWYPVGKKKEMA